MTALEKYEGTIITVSHDRGFIGRVANKILEVNNGLFDFFIQAHMMNMSGVCKKRFLAERTGTDTIAVSTGRSITNSETSSRFKL